MLRRRRCYCYYIKKVRNEKKIAALRFDKNNFTSDLRKNEELHRNTFTPTTTKDNETNETDRTKKTAKNSFCC